MPGVGFLGMLVIGILAGWIAEKITASDHGLLTNPFGRHSGVVRWRLVGQVDESPIRRLARHEHP